MSDGSAGFITVEGLTKEFVNGVNPISLFDGISLEIDHGDSVSIIGESGVGKSTLLSLMATIESPTSGVVRYDGRDVTTLDDAELSVFRNRSMGFVFQFHHLLPEFTAAENVAMPPRIAGVEPAAAMRRAEEVLDGIGLGERKDHRPAQLSGGEQQRVAVARAFVHGPRVIYADEPTGNLDERNSEIVARMLFEIVAAERITLVIVTHNRDIARMAKRPFLIRDRKLFEG